MTTPQEQPTPKEPTLNPFQRKGLAERLGLKVLPFGEDLGGACPLLCLSIMSASHAARYAHSPRDGGQHRDEEFDYLFPVYFHGHFVFYLTKANRPCGATKACFLTKANRAFALLRLTGPSGLLKCIAPMISVP